MTEKPLADLIRGVVWVGDRSDPSVLVTMRADIHEALAEVAVCADAVLHAAPHACEALYRALAALREKAGRGE